VRATIEFSGSDSGEGNAASVVECDLLMGVVGNTRLYGGVAHLTGRARADDGLLDVCLLAAAPVANRVQVTWAALRGRLPALAERSPYLEYRRATHLRISADAPLDVQVDGDWIGYTPVDIKIDPQSLWVLVPPGPSVLWSEPSASRLAASS
jgi:diacylglycerol kinase (ATP)